MVLSGLRVRAPTSTKRLGAGPIRLPPDKASEWLGTGHSDVGLDGRHLRWETKDGRGGGTGQNGDEERGGRQGVEAVAVASTKEGEPGIQSPKPHHADMTTRFTYRMAAF